MNVSLTPELEKIIQEYVATGHYNNASEVVREALRLFIRTTRSEDPYKAYLRREIDKGIESIEKYGTVPFDMDKIIQEVLEEQSDS